MIQIQYRESSAGSLIESRRRFTAVAVYSLNLSSAAAVSKTLLEVEPTAVATS